MDPTGRITIKDNFIPDLLFAYKSNVEMIVVPIGGGATKYQNDLYKLNNVVNVGVGLIPDAGTFSSIFQTEVSLDSAYNIVSTVAGMISERAGVVISYVDLLKAISTDLNIDPNKYSNDQIDSLMMCGIEQAFIKDLSKALKEKEIDTNFNCEENSSFIMNMSVYATDVYSSREQIMEIAEKVKASNENYTNVEIQ